MSRTNEWRELLIPRLSKGLDYHINLPPGWRNPIMNLVKELDQLLGDWRISRAESKYAELWFEVDYLGNNKETNEIVVKLIHDAEKECRSLCQACGALGGLSSKNYNIMILCEDCKSIRKQESDEALR